MYSLLIINLMILYTFNKITILYTCTSKPESDFMLFKLLPWKQTKKLHVPLIVSIINLITHTRTISMIS